MRFALLGFDPAILPLIRAIAESDEHRLVWLDDDASRHDRARSLCPEAATASDWEGLLDGQMVDAVVVARGDNAERAVEQLRLLLQNDLPVIVEHPIHEDALPGYELDMIREERGGILFPYTPWRWHPVIKRIEELAASGGSGTSPDTVRADEPWEQVTFERSLHDTSPKEVRRQFARDVDLAHVVCGDLTHLAAMCPHGEQRWDNLGVQLSGPSGTLFRWSVETSRPDTAAVIRFRGAAGTATATIYDDERWHLEWHPTSGPTQSDSGSWQPGKAVLQEFQLLVAQHDESRAARHWRGACRATELASVIDRSLARGKTIELRLEGYDDERGNFQATMSTLGCGLLLVAFFVSLVASVLGAFGLDLSVWPYLLIGVLGAFLLLQALGWLIPSAPAPAGGVDASGEDSRGSNVSNNRIEQSGAEGVEIEHRMTVRANHAEPE